MIGFGEKYPSKLLEDAVDAISSLPGIGRRSALRLALHLLNQPEPNVKNFTNAIDNLRTKAVYCENCMMLSDSEICPICSDRTRRKDQICVVATIRDVMSIEDTGQYRGLYHVLGGVISPIEGIGPSDLTTDKLRIRVETLMKELGSAEVIFALSGDVEGETTALYIYKILEKTGVKMSSLARGLGFGDDLEYADEFTLGRSIMNRRPYTPGSI